MSSLIACFSDVRPTVAEHRVAVRNAAAAPEAVAFATHVSREAQSEIIISGGIVKINSVTRC